MKRIRRASIVFVLAAMIATACASSANAEIVFTLAGKFGVYGEKEGQIRNPHGSDTDASGNLWIASGEPARVIEYSPEGKWLMQFTGSGEHKLIDASDVEFDDSSGNIWVADYTGEAVAQYNTKGEFIREVKPTEIGGAHWKPFDVAVDSKGYVWANGVSNDQKRILKFKPNGERDGKKEVSLIHENFVTDSEDHLWVDNPINGRLDEYSSEGVYLGQIGEGVLPKINYDTVIDTEGNFWSRTNKPSIVGINPKGEFIGSFVPEKPEVSLCCLAAASDGNLWLISHDFQALIQKWSAAPAVITEAASGVTTSEATLNGSVNPHGLETTYQFEYGTGSDYGKVAPASPNSIGKGTEFLKASPKVTGLEANTIYHFRIKATNSHGTTYGEDKWFNAGTHEWGMQATPEQAESTGSTLRSVSCVASETCVAVGTTSGGPSAGLLAKVESAGQWSLSAPPKPAGAVYFNLEDVSCTAVSACTAVGGWNLGSGYSPLAERWNGSSWSIQSTPAPPEAKWTFLWGVTCVASNDCIAVGGAGASQNLHSTLVERWNGSSWSIVSTPNPEGTKSELRSVSCVSANDCWAVGNSKGTTALAEHWNGTAWSINSPTLSSGLTDVSCSSSSSCVATSEGLTLARWNGSKWSTETAVTPTGAKFASLSDISCTSASACVATGSYTDANWVPRQLAESWDGSKWSVQSTSAPAAVENAKKEVEGEAGLTGGVSCTSATACTAVGSSWTPATGTRSLVNVRH
jgi:hypothetical protein